VKNFYELACYRKGQEKKANEKEKGKEKEKKVIKRVFCLANSQLR
jgi:hypothetical protein